MSWLRFLRNPVGAWDWQSRLIGWATRHADDADPLLSKVDDAADSTPSIGHRYESDYEGFTTALSDHRNFSEAVVENPRLAIKVVEELEQIENAVERTKQTISDVADTIADPATRAAAKKRIVDFAKGTGQKLKEFYNDVMGKRASRFKEWLIDSKNKWLDNNKWWVSRLQKNWGKVLAAGFTLYMFPPLAGLLVYGFVDSVKWATRTAFNVIWVGVGFIGTVVITLVNAFSGNGDSEETDNTPKPAPPKPENPEEPEIIEVPSLDMLDQIRPITEAEELSTIFAIGLVPALFFAPTFALMLGIGFFASELLVHLR